MKKLLSISTVAAAIALTLSISVGSESPYQGFRFNGSTDDFAQLIAATALDEDALITYMSEKNYFSGGASYNDSGVQVSYTKSAIQARLDEIQKSYVAVLDESNFPVATALAENLSLNNNYEIGEGKSINFTTFYTTNRASEIMEWFKDYDGSLALIPNWRNNIECYSVDYEGGDLPSTWADTKFVFIVDGQLIKVEALGFDNSDDVLEQLENFSFMHFGELIDKNIIDITTQTTAPTTDLIITTTSNARSASTSSTDVPKGGVVLAIIPTLLAGMGVAISKKRK